MTKARGPITDAERAKVRRLHKQGMSRNDIARQLGRSTSTITDIVRQLGLNFDRTKTAAATAAKVVDAKARRAELAAALLDDVDRLRERAWGPYQQAMGTPQGVEIITLKLPPLRDQQSAYQAVGTCIGRHLDLTKHDADTGVDEKGMLGELLDRLRAARGK